jgi:butyrate kinase
VSRLTGTYSGTSLASDVTRALAASGLSANSVTCADTAQVDAGVITDCTAMLDGRLTAVRVTWTDAAGHFALTEKAP